LVQHVNPQRKLKEGKGRGQNLGTVELKSANCKVHTEIQVLSSQVGRGLTNSAQHTRT
jgi:hypothetical protein